MKRVWVCLLLFLVCVAPVLAQDQGWPRVITKNGATLITYQPQVDEWQNFQRLTWRQAISLTSPGASKPTVGVLNMKGVTAADTDTQLVLISGIELVSSYFPDLNPQQKAQVEQQVRQFIPETVTIAMHRIVASLPKNKPAPTVQLNNTPPAIYVAYQPSILLLVDGKPALTDIKETHLKAVVNANWPLFTDKSRYFLFTGKEWMVSQSLEQGWAPTTDLPKDFEKLPQDQEYADLKGAIPAPSPNGPTPQIFFSAQPAEMIEFNGQPSYSAPITGTQIVYATNTDSIVFAYQPTTKFYFLAAGRWFSASSLNGPWTYATPNLPADFAKIPPTDPAAVVLASVPGTPEAADAVVLAQVPTSVNVDPAKAAANVQVKYSGDPQFQPIAGTSLQYAVNTPNKVIQVGSMYYVCYQGVWFLSSSPMGPWQTATSVPQEIYSIPPSSPVYNVTYVTQNTTSDGSVQASYTAGYLGTFIAGAAVGAVIADGSGYYWPGYVGWGAVAPYYAHPATYGAAALYNPYTGAYGMGHAAYGPYGGAAWGASYNPYTGTYAHGATAYGPYGNSRSAAEAYNPYTGGYAATRQGSSPYGSWGSSVVGNGNNWAATQHASTAYGSYGRAETSAGGQAAGASTVRGNTGVAQTASGDMYAGHDGNVYKNTGDGWQKYGSNGWSSVNQGTSQSAWNQRAEQAQAQGYNRGGEQSSQLNQEAQDRARGGQSADRFQQSAAGGGSGERGGEAGGFEQRADAGGFGDRSGGGSWGGSRGSWGDRGGFSGGGRGGSSGGGRRR